MHHPALHLHRTRLRYLRFGPTAKANSLAPRRRHPVGTNGLGLECSASAPFGSSTTARDMLVLDHSNS